MKNLIRSIAILALVGLSAHLAAQTASTSVWHIPFNQEVPFEDGTPNQLQMRFPYMEIAPGATFIVYQGFDKDNFANGNQDGGKVWFRDVTADGTWDSVNLEFHQGNDVKQFWKGIIDLSAKGIPGLNIVEYYVEVNFSDRDTTYIYGGDLAPGDQLETLTEATAQAGAYSIRNRPAWIFHAENRVLNGDNVQFWAKVGYIGDVNDLSTRWVNAGAVYYTTNGDSPSGSLGTASGSSVAAAFTFSHPEQNEIDGGSVTGGRGMWWASDVNGLLTGLPLGSTVKYKIGFWNTDTGEEKFADHNAVTDNDTFEFSNGAIGDPILTVSSASTGTLNGNYTTTKVFIDEIAGDSIPITITFEPGESATEIEIVSNLNQRDYAQIDKNANDRDDGMEFNQTEGIIGTDLDHYYRKYSIIGNPIEPGKYQLVLNAARTGAYRLTARWKVDGDANWRWFTFFPADRKDHAITVSPIDARDLRVYEINTLTIEADATGNFIDRSTFEDLWDKPGAPRTADGRGFNLNYLSGLGVNWLWFQPIHPPAIDGREIDPATSSAYEPGSPYAVKNFFEVNPWMSADYDGTESGGINGTEARAEAMASFQEFSNAADGQSIQIMLDAPFNHTAFDVEFGPLYTLFERYDDGIILTPETEIRNYDTRFFSRDNNYGERATLTPGEGPAEAPDRGDFGKWNDVKDVYFGRYDALVRLNPSDDGQYLSEGDRFNYAALGSGTDNNPEDFNWDNADFSQDLDPGPSEDLLAQNVTRQVWRYFAQYGPYWLEKTRPNGENMNSADWIDSGNILTTEQRYQWDAKGIDGLRCDFGQGLPPQAWEYMINVARNKKWNFVMMSESLDGGAVTYRSNRHFDILNENIVFPFKNAGNAGDYRSIFDNRRNAYGQGLVLLNNTSHDEENYSNIWHALMRYNVASTVDGAPMIFMGQELGVTETSGFTFYESNFGKNIAHFKKFNSMKPAWDNRVASPFGEEFIFDAFGAAGQARAFSPALRNSNRYYLNRKAGGVKDEIWSVAKYETPGASPAISDVVFAFVNLRTDDSPADTFEVNIDDGSGNNLFGIKSARLYNVKNIAAYTKIDGTRRNTWLWDDSETSGFESRTGLDILDDGLFVELNSLPADQAEWTSAPYEVQYLKLYDVTAPTITPGTPIMPNNHDYEIGTQATFDWADVPADSEGIVPYYEVTVIINSGQQNTFLTQDSQFTVTASVGQQVSIGVRAVNPDAPENKGSSSSYQTIKLLFEDGDEDGDGRTNVDEKTAGTNPRDRDSFFVIASQTLESNGDITITWAAVVGKTYTIQSRVDLVAGDWINDATGQTSGTYTDTPAEGEDKKFYRVVVE